MTGDVEMRDVPTQYVAIVRASTPASEISIVLPRIIGQVYESLKTRGIKPNGPPIAIYDRFEPNQVDYAGGVPVSGVTAGDGAVEPRTLPGGRVAFARHLGPYSGLGETHTAIQSWIAAHSHTHAGSCWESYPMPPGGEPNPAKVVTEVYYPIS